MSYAFKTTPLGHQLEKFLRTQDLEWFGDFDEQGTGKSKVAIDLAGRLYQLGKIDAVLVVAPSGVERNWVSDEVPKHLPDELYRASRLHVYKTQTKISQRQKGELDDLLGHQGLAWLAISYDAFMTKYGKNSVWRFLKKRRVLYLLDEAHRIRNAVKRTTSIVASAKYAPYRRAMTGTPTGNGGPFDVYKLFEFLDDGFWKRLDIANFTAFKAEYGRWQDRTITKKTGKLAGKTITFPDLLGYRNVDRLREILRPYCSRVRKADVLDLPPKVYTSRYFELTQEQRDVYERLREELFIVLDDQRTVTAMLPIVFNLRAHQISCGYLPCDGEDPELRFKRNPRLELFEDLLEDVQGQALVWARFTPDVDQIMKVLGDRAVRYDGEVDDDERERSKQAFHRGDAQFFVSKPQVGGSGLTLVEASTEIFYSNSFSFIDRLQSEDRAHRIGQTKSVLIIDLLGEGTVDSRIVETLKRGEDVANQLTGDELRSWFQEGGI